MKTQMTWAMAMVAALAVGAPASAGQEPAAAAAAAARAAADAQEAVIAARGITTVVRRADVERAVIAAREAAATIRSADVQQAVIAAREAVTTIRSADVQRAVIAAQEAVTTIRSADVQRAVIAAQEAVSVWQPHALEAVAVVHEGGWAQLSDRDRESMRAQRERELAARDAAREKERAQRERERENQYYDQGQSALDSGRWDRAVASFDRVVELKGARADAALYWKAYAQNRQGQRPEALATINALIGGYPKSRYVNDAKALEVEVKARTGQVNPADESDEELQLMALAALQNSEEGIPILQKILQGNRSPRLKSRALFVLAQSNSPRAREVLVNIAKGGANPDLQMKSVQYLGNHGNS
jgi:hypothetical protein